MASSDVPAVLEAVELGGADALVRGIHALRAEMADRDGELRDVLARLGRLYERLAGGAPRDDESVTALLRSIDTLATVTEASVDRASDLSRSLQHVVEALTGLATRVDRLVRRTDESEARLERVVHVVEGLSEQVTMIGRNLGSPASSPRPRLRAVGRHDDAPADPLDGVD